MRKTNVPHFRVGLRFLLSREGRAARMFLILMVLAWCLIVAFAVNLLMFKASKHCKQIREGIGSEVVLWQSDGRAIRGKLAGAEYVAALTSMGWIDLEIRIENAESIDVWRWPEREDPPIGGQGVVVERLRPWELWRAYVSDSN